MLTHHNYTDIIQDWDKDTILECCQTNNPGSTLHGLLLRHLGE